MPASMIDYRAPRGLDKALILAQLTATGMGKTSNACALAHQACRQGVHHPAICASPGCSKICASPIPTPASPIVGGEVWDVVG